MACYIVPGKEDEAISFFMCGNLGQHCADCMSPSDNLCDYPVGKGKTCDRAICDFHSHEIGPNLHYCETHFEEWKKFEESGGVKKRLKNVVPFKK